MKIMYAKLRGRIVEKFGSQRAFAAEVGQSEQTVTKKMNDPEGFTQADMLKWCSLLDIEIEEIPEYFFAHHLSK